jgi:hypothetical protein
MAQIMNVFTEMMPPIAAYCGSRFQEFLKNGKKQGCS